MARMTKYTTKLTENKRVVLEKEISMNCPTLSYAIKSPDDAAQIGKEFMRIHEEPEEYMYMICMNTKNKVIGVFEISHGTVNASLVTPREVFQKALLATGNATLTHSIGKSKQNETVLTKTEFCSRLTKIRSRLQNGEK